NGSGMFHYCDLDGMGYEDDLINGVIATGQAFWVRTTDINPELTIQEGAKSTLSGGFYREETPTLDLLSISLHRQNLRDVAYIKLKPEATEDLDPFDAPKLANDNFNFSSRLTTGLTMAVNTMNTITCGKEIALDLSFVKSGANYVINPVSNYTLAFDMKGKLTGYTVTLVDTYKGTSHSVVSGSTIEFSITTDPESMVNDRFRILLNENVIQVNPEITSSNICGDD